MFKAFKFLFLPLIVMIGFFTACDKSTDITSDEFVDQALYSAQERGGIGRFGCYELVFPVTITLPDESTAEVDSYEDLKQTLRAYFEANGGGHGRPRPHISFVFPISLIDEAGEVITVESQDELIELRRACAGSTFGNHGPQGHGQHGLRCFDLVFPITIVFPDGSTAQAADRQEFRQLIREWKQANPGIPGRPKIGFPLTVKMDEDGTLVTVNSPEELRELKQNCD